MMFELKELGLTEYEARVYEALVSLGATSGGRVAKKSKVPHGKTYEALHSLADKGLITILPTRPQTFNPLPPEDGIKQMINTKINKLSSAGQKVIKQIKKPEKKPTVHERIEVYTGLKKQFEIANNLLINARDKYYIYSKGEKVPTSLLINIKKAVNRGVDVRLIVYEYDGNQGVLNKFKNAGMKLRYLPRGEFTLAVKDDDELIQVVRNPKNHEDRISIYYKDKAMAKAMTEYYKLIWKKAKVI